MERNPFEVMFSKEFLSLQDENLDFYMLGLKRIRQLSWQFNPWWHRIPNYILSLLESKKDKSRYADIDPHEYLGIERRKNPRVWIDEQFNDLYTLFREMRMPKTQKIVDIKEAA